MIELSQDHTTSHRRTGLLVAAWLWVGIPLAYGLYMLSTRVAQLFHG